MTLFEKRFKLLTEHYNTLLHRANIPVPDSNGIYQRFTYPILSADHVPLHWRYDLNPKSNPFLMERLGVGAVFNAGAIKFNGKYLVIARVEGTDRKSFFAIAQTVNMRCTHAHKTDSSKLDQVEESVGH
jgi:4-O-beta-D-mannosyl-D-glucose phosphorylase